MHLLEIKCQARKNQTEKKNENQNFGVLNALND